MNLIIKMEDILRQETVEVKRDSHGRFWMEEEEIAKLCSTLPPDETTTVRVLILRNKKSGESK